MTTLKVERAAGSDPVTIPHISGGEPIDVNGGQQVELELGHLLSDPFKQELSQGRFRFVKSPADNEKVELARKVLPLLLEDLSPPLLALHSSAKRSRTSLAEKRDNYNAAHKVTLKLLNQAGGLAKAPKNLYDGADHWLKSLPEQTAVDEVFQKILDHKAKEPPEPDPGATAEEIETAKKDWEESWYIDLLDLQAEYQQAQRSLEYAQTKYVNDLKPVLDGLAEAAAAFEAAATDPGIGSEISDW